MTRKTYQHYCPVARSLEVIGDKWSLLVVRDLLRGPLRFTDLLRYLGGITPKWLTLRLRQLEEAGIVERDSEPGRREVRYRLTPKGESLQPVIESLIVWGFQHAMRPPQEDEPVYPEQTLLAMVAMLNHLETRLDWPATWLLRFGAGAPNTVRFDGERWSVETGEADADVSLEAEPETWVRFLTSSVAQRRRLVKDLRIDGPDHRVAELLDVFGLEPLPAR